MLTAPFACPAIASQGLSRASLVAGASATHREWSGLRCARGARGKEQRGGWWVRTVKRRGLRGQGLSRDGSGMRCLGLLNVLARVRRCRYNCR